MRTRTALALALLEFAASFVAICALLAVSGATAPTWPDAGLVFAQAAALWLCCILCFYYSDLYDLRVVRSFDEFLPRLLKSILLALILITALYSVLPRRSLGGDQALLALLMVAWLLIALRGVYYVVTSKHLFAERVLILGGGPLARWLASEIEASPHLRYSLVGVVDDGADEEESEQGAVPKAQSFVPLHNVEKAITKLGVQRIIVALRERRGRLPLRELLESTVDGVIIEDGIDVFERITGKIAIETLVPSDILFSGSFRKSHWRLAVARVISFLAALVGVVFLSPVFLVLAIAIKLDSRGPVLFVHRRLGLKNRPFNLFKFRTMAPSTFKTTEWVKDNEARITRLGDWLRNYRLDELPQLFNVIRGDMNLVGPRPHPVTNRRLFMENISYYTLRSMVRPGITGWAQVRYGYANNLEQETEKMRFDLYYIKHMSLWLDVQILLDTARIVLFGRERKERRLTPQVIFIGGRRRGDQPTSYKAELPKPGVPLTHGHAQRNAGP